MLVKAGCAIHERKTMTKQLRDSECTKVFKEFIRTANVSTLSTDLRCDTPVATQWDMIVKKTIFLADKQGEWVRTTYILEYKNHVNLKVTKNYWPSQVWRRFTELKSLFRNVYAPQWKCNSGETEDDALLRCSKYDWCTRKNKNIVSSNKKKADVKDHAPKVNPSDCDISLDQCS